MPLPRVVARFNKRYTNRFLLPLAQRSSGFAVVEHIGRVSGKVRRTPVNVFWLDDDAIVTLTYGPEADWVRNVVAAGGSLGVNAADTRPIDAVELVGRDVSWPVLPWFVRLAVRGLTVHHFLRIKLRP